MDLIQGGVRWILWNIARGMLKITDFMFDIVTSLFKIGINDFSWIWKVYWIFAGVVGVFIAGRLTVILFKSWYDETPMQKLSNGTVFFRVIACALILTLVPVAMPVVSEIATNSTMILNANDTKPSDILIEGGLADFTSDLNNYTQIELEEGQHIVDVITGDWDSINEQITVEGSNKKSYKYFSDMANLLLTIVISAMCLYAFLMLSLQIVQRLLGLLLKIIIAPYALSGLVDPDDNGTSAWMRLTLADFIGAIGQITLVWLSLNIVANLPSGLNYVAKAIFFIGCIMAIIIAPSGIAQLLGSDVGAQTGMQMMQQFMALGGMVRTGQAVASGALGFAKSVGGSVAGGVKTGASWGVYGLGQAMGARSLNPNTPKGGSSNGGGSFPDGGGSSDVGESSGGFDGGGSSNGGFSNGGGGVAPSFNSSNSSSYSGGVSDSGSDPSEMEYAGSFDQGVNSMQSAGFSVGTDGVLHYDDGNVTNGQLHVPFTKVGVKPGGMAGYFASHLYQASARRIFTSEAQRQKIKENTAPIDKFNNMKNNVSGFGNAMKESANNIAQRKINMANRQAEGWQKIIDHNSVSLDDYNGGVADGI